ncbi:Carboxylic ester hydrolase [Mycena sanguinolenta]|uniref:Carboxylic ester hydrolase n=1 Tax=Mycena sanguinolenta TaxID=230812 RepID=A0A8H7D219_9AGAR|nr:Carboxylic ester hydrolase [Mycena sanguinolenta]
MLSLPTAELVAIFIGSVLYGIYLVTLGITTRVLLTKETGHWRTRSEVNWIAVSFCGMLFVNSTLDLSLGMYQIVDAFVLYTGPGGPLDVFMHGSSWQTVIKTSCVGLQSLIGDGLLIYRCWLLWRTSSQIRAVFPVLIWLTNLAIYVRLMVLLTKVTQGLVTGATLQPWGSSFWVLTICINITATALIVWKIWLVERENKAFRATDDNLQRSRTRLDHAVRNIVESGMICTTASILVVAAYTAKSTLNYPASALEVHSVGITFNLIIIRGTRRPVQDQSAVTPIRFSQNQSLGSIRPTTRVINDTKAETYPLSHLPKSSKFESVETV